MRFSGNEYQKGKQEQADESLKLMKFSEACDGDRVVNQVK